MPVYSYRCSCGAVKDQYSRVSERDSNIPTCHGPMTRQLSVAFIGIQANIHAISPIDGTPLTSRRQRAEYMKRNSLEDAVPAAETIRNAKARKAENERLAAQIPKLPEHVIRQLQAQA